MVKFCFRYILVNFPKFLEDLIFNTHANSGFCYSKVIKPFIIYPLKASGNLTMNPLSDAIRRYKWKYELISAILFLEVIKFFMCFTNAKKIRAGFYPIKIKITYMLKISACYLLLILLLYFLFFHWLNGLTLQGFIIWRLVYFIFFLFCLKCNQM